MENKKLDTIKEKGLTNQSSSKPALAFDKINYFMMIGGVVVILLGYAITASESAPHGFGFMGLTLGPIIIFLGFMFEIVAILYKKK